MEKTRYFTLLVFLLLLGKTFAQFPIFMPTSESSVMTMSPMLPGFEYKSRFALNQMTQFHPLGNVQSLNLSYDTDIPKLALLTGIQVAGDRIGTKNQNLMVRANLAYELKLAMKTKMVFSFHMNFGQQKINEASYFNRYDYRDSVYQNLTGSSTVNYYSNTFGMGIRHPFFYGGWYVMYRSPHIGDFNGEKLHLNYNTTFYLGIKLNSSIGLFRPYFGHTYCASYTYFDSPIYAKFPRISSLNFAVSYQRNKFNVGLGIRTMKHFPTMYHTQFGFEFKHIKAMYSIGVSPYQNSTLERKYGVTSQATLEVSLKRHKKYHRPVETSNMEFYPNNSTKVVRYYIDNELVNIIELDLEGNEILTKNFKNGVLNGYYSEYDSESKLIISGNYRMGVKEGKWTYVDADYNLVKREKYVDGNLIETEVIDPNK